MNLLEQLAAKWYSLRGYFVQTNLKYGARSKGGWIGEMDVVAFHPQTKELLHVETSMDAASWAKRTERFGRKFETAERYYAALFQFSYSHIRRLAIVGYHAEPRTDALGAKIQMISVPEFISQITAELKGRHPLHQAIPENKPLLRSMQFALHWG